MVSRQSADIHAGHHAGITRHHLGVALGLVVRVRDLFNLGGGLGETESEKNRGGEGFDEIDFGFHNIVSVST